MLGSSLVLEDPVPPDTRPLRIDSVLREIEKNVDRHPKKLQARGIPDWVARLYQVAFIPEIVFGRPNCGSRSASRITRPTSRSWPSCGSSRLRQPARSRGHRDNETRPSTGASNLLKCERVSLTRLGHARVTVRKGRISRQEHEIF